LQAYFGARETTIFSKRIAAQRVPAYFALRPPRMTDRVLILIVEQTKASSPESKQRNLLGLHYRGFSLRIFLKL
jgi:hypothetical protein